MRMNVRLCDSASAAWRIPIAALLMFSLAPAARAGEVTDQAPRLWNDNTGSFSVRAILREIDPEAKSVTLELTDGRRVVVPQRRLSDGDQTYVQRLNAVPESVAVAGIDWFEDLADAKRAAAGRKGSRDDKPIMCFRVLGELDGFM